MSCARPLPRRTPPDASRDFATLPRLVLLFVVKRVYERGIRALAQLAEQMLHTVADAR